MTGVKKPFFTVDKMTKLAMLTAVGVVLYALEFPIFPAAPNLKLNFSDMPALIASFMFGPIEGIIVTLFKVALGLLLQITKDVGVGDLANAIIGILYVVPAGLFYGRKRTLNRAVISLAVASVVMIIGTCISNLFIMMPLYGITDYSLRFSLIFSVYLPFNAIKAVGTSLLTFLAYKPLHLLFNRIRIENDLKYDVITKNSKQTEKYGEAFAKILAGGETVVLCGELGAGKTQFTKGIAKGLGVKDEITSPTFALHNVYEGKINLNHFDFYRLTAEEGLNLGFEEIIGQNDSVSVIEWADNVPALIPAHYYKITLTVLTDNTRRIIIEEV